MVLVLAQPFREILAAPDFPDVWLLGDVIAAIWDERMLRIDRLTKLGDPVFESLKLCLLSFLLSGIG